MSLLVIVPSRGRSANVRRLRQAWADTGATATLIVAVDDDDPTLPEYVADGPVEIGPRRGMIGTLNAIAVEQAPHYDQIGFLGDDNLPRSLHWDDRITGALTDLGTGIAYGNDLIHGAALPTAAFMTSDVIRALGWMTLPTLTHLYPDNVWQELGRALEAITYLPDVIIEHLHPIAGKADWDDGYRRVNDGTMYAHDRAAFDAWMADGIDADVAKIRTYTSTLAASA